MYYIEDKDQLVIEDFAMPFGGKLDPKNRWVRLAGIMPWDEIEEIYLRTMSTETGRRAFPSRIAFGSIFIKEYRNFTDEECVSEIQENPYMQYFLGLHEFQQEPLFDPSMMVHFRDLPQISVFGELLNSEVAVFFRLKHQFCPQQHDTTTAIHHSFDHLQFIICPFHKAVAQRRRHCVFHSINVFE